MLSIAAIFQVEIQEPHDLHACSTFWIVTLIRIINPNPVLQWITWISPACALCISLTCSNINIKTPVDFPEREMGSIYCVLKTLKDLLKPSINQAPVVLWLVNSVRIIPWVALHCKTSFFSFQFLFSHTILLLLNDSLFFIFHNQLQCRLRLALKFTERASSRQWNKGRQRSRKWKLLGKDMVVQIVLSYSNASTFIFIWLLTLNTWVSWILWLSHFQ